MMSAENYLYENDEEKKEEEEEEVKKEDDQEINVESSSNEHPVNLENSCGNNKDNVNLNNDDFIIRLIFKFRSFLGQLFFGDGIARHILHIVVVNGIAGAILVASIVRYVADDYPPLDYCDDVGFLWILFGIIYGIHFSYLIKPCWNLVLEHQGPTIAVYWEKLTSSKCVQRISCILPFIIIGAYVISFPGKTGRRVYSFVGILVFLAVGFVLSKYPKQVKWRTVIAGIILQFLFGLFAISMNFGQEVLGCIGRKISSFLSYTDDGSEFVYGYLSKPHSLGRSQQLDAIFAFSVLPTIFFLNFFFNILSYYGILQWLIMKVGWTVKIFMGTTVCESMNAAASIFFGMTEAPLLVQSYLKDLTRSEMCAIMCAGWSTVAGSVMAAYIIFGIDAAHLISASVMSAPAALSLSKLLYPETEYSKNTIENIVLEKKRASNALDSACRGALAGISIVAGVTANIIAFLAFMSFLDGTLMWLGDQVGLDSLSLKYLMSKLFIPVSFLMGVEMDSLEEVAYLVGVKTVANEFQAFQILGDIVKKGKISQRSEIIATYALCGFSNFGSVGITVGALSIIEPRQRSNITNVALQAFLSANITCFMTACVAGCLIQ